MPTPYTISYLFEDKAHTYLPDVTGQFLDGSLLIAEAGLEQDKRKARNRAKAEAARKVAEQQGGSYWIGTEATLAGPRHANLVFLHARRQGFPAWPQLEEALQVIWPWGEAACVQELVERLRERWPQAEKEAAIWKRCAESAARGHLLVDLASVSLTRLTPLICLSPDSPPILPDPLPSELASNASVAASESLEAEPEPDQRVSIISTGSRLHPPRHPARALPAPSAGRRSCASRGDSRRDGPRSADCSLDALASGAAHVAQLGAMACVPYATYSRERVLHPAFQEAIRLLYTRPTRLSLRAIAEHAELVRVAKRLQQDTGTAITLPSYDQVRAYVKTLKQEPQVRSARGEARGPQRERQSPRSFALSVPAPAQLAKGWMSIAWNSMSLPQTAFLSPVAFMQPCWSV